MSEPNWLSDLAVRNAEDYRRIPERIRAAAELEHRRRTIEATKRNLGPTRQAAGLADAPLLQVASIEDEIERVPLETQSSRLDAESLLKDYIKERDKMAKRETKERDPSELYFSPKTGAIKKRPVRSIKMFRQVAEILSKAKTDTLTIDCDTVTAHAAGFDLVGCLDFGDISVVTPTKDFLVAATSLERLEGSQIFPNFEEYSMSITREGKTVRVPIQPPSEADLQHPTGIPLHELSTETFPQAFFQGGAACATQSKEFPGLDVVVCKGGYVRSTDAKFAFEYDTGSVEGRQILISGDAYRMFRKIDLPITRIELSELALTFEFFGGYQLICPQQDGRVPPNASLKFESIHPMSLVTLDGDFWKSLKLLSKAKRVRITRDGKLMASEIGVSTPFGFETGSDEDLMFCPKQLYKLKAFDGEGVRFGFSTKNDNGRIASFATSLQGKLSVMLAGKYRKV